MTPGFCDSGGGRIGGREKTLVLLPEPGGDWTISYGAEPIEDCDPMDMRLSLCRMEPEPEEGARGTGPEVGIFGGIGGGGIRM